MSTATEKPPQEASNETVQPNLRKRKLVRKQGGPSKLNYTLWVTGHSLSIVFGLVFIVWQVLFFRDYYHLKGISYRLGLGGAALAYFATMSHKFGLRYLPQFPALLAQLNFQYLVLVTVGCFTFKTIFKILPIFLISVLQIARHKKISFVLKHANFLATVIAFNEIILLAYLLLRTLFFRQTSGFQLVLVLYFMWMRVMFDEATTELFGYVIDKLDTKVSTVKNEKVLKVWNKIKRNIDEKRLSMKST